MIATATVAVRFLNPFDPIDIAQKRRLIETGNARHPERPGHMEHIVPTLGVWLEGRMVGYAQFTVAIGVTYLYGLRVDTDLRGQRLGRRLMATWLREAAKVGARMAVGCAATWNLGQRALFDLARFESDGMIAAVPEDEHLYVGGHESFAWAEAEPEEAWIPWER